MIVVDSCKEQSLGEFAKEYRKSDCYLCNTEPYTPLQMAAKGCFECIKQASARTMLLTGISKTLWDHCIEYQALVRSHTALDIYGFQGQVPKTVMMGEAADISNLCEYK